MKILHAVEFYHPSVGGMQEVVRQLSERLVQKGHELTVVTSWLAERPQKTHNGVHIVEFQISGNLIQGFNGDIQAYREFVFNGSFDLITCFAAQQWTCDALLPVLDRVNSVKVFVPTGFSTLSSPIYRDYFAAMPGWLNQFDMNIFLSNQYRDIDFARQHGVTRQKIIPNGAAADEFMEPQGDIRPCLGIPSDHFLILHVGSHTWLKGHEEAIEIFQRAKIVSATLLIVGRDSAGGCGPVCRERAACLNKTVAFHHADKRIMVMELPRAETVAAYQSADLFLFPSLIECSPVVLFECMASRTPFLASEAGNSAEIVKWSGGSGMLLPTERPSWLQRFAKVIQGKRRLGDDLGAVHVDINESAVLLERLWHDLDRRVTMAQAGFTAWQQRFTWEYISEEYETLYQKLLTGGGVA